MKTKNTIVFALLLMAFGLTACSDSDHDPVPPPVTSTSSVTGSAVKGPVEGAEIHVFYFDDNGNLVEIDAQNAPVMTDASGAYEFLLNTGDIEDITSPLIVRTAGGTMGDPPGPAPTLESVIADSTSLASPDNTVSCQLSLASSVAAGLLIKKATETATAPSIDDANTCITRVQEQLGVDLSEDPTDPATGLAMLNHSVDENLDLIDTPDNNLAVNEYVDYLVANLSSTSGVLDGLMDDPSNPGTDCPADFGPFGSGELASLVPDGPQGFLDLRISMNRKLIWHSVEDEVTITAEVKDACGNPVNGKTVWFIFTNPDMSPDLTSRQTVNGVACASLKEVIFCNMMIEANIALPNGEDLKATLLNPLTPTLHVQPPLGNDSGDANTFDPTLIDLLTVSVCEGTGGDCNTVATFTSKSADPVVLQDTFYEVIWEPSQADAGKNFQIHFDVAGLELKFIRYDVSEPGNVPIKFRIDNHPSIRARVLHAQGFTATQSAGILTDEFGLDAADTAQVLMKDRYEGPEIREALWGVFGLDAWPVEDVIMFEHILDAAGYQPEQYLESTAFHWVERFAPVLKFDSEHYGLPMSADVYFKNMLNVYTVFDDASLPKIWWEALTYGPALNPEMGIIKVCGRDYCTSGMQNNDFPTLTSGQVPTYYHVLSDIDALDEGRLRIRYWWFYGFQSPCNNIGYCPSPKCGKGDGAHHGDWENVIITTTPDRSGIEAVTYSFHGHWYTRQNFEYYGERPVAYVGKLAHGMYHGQEHSCYRQFTPWQCCEYADCRVPAPDGSTVWANTYDNLVYLGGNSESWMRADPIGSKYIDDEGYEYLITDWSWGPRLAWCYYAPWLGCADWEHTTACETHPTQPQRKPTWTMSSCYNKGCDGSGGFADCNYEAKYDQGWPFGYTHLNPPGNIIIVP